MGAVRAGLGGRLLLLCLLAASLYGTPCAAAQKETKPAEPRVVHIFVALCDNKYQGIHPVPAALGNGQAPSGNLYWGAMYGVKTWFSRQAGWQLVKREKDPLPYILERVVFKRKGNDLYLVADAYNGRNMRQCLRDFFRAASAGLPEVVTLETEAGGRVLFAGGRAQLAVFVGHNGLMEIRNLDYPKSVSGTPRQAAVFACQSRFFFKGPLAKSGATPLILTTGNMAPEAYSVDALVTAWSAGQSPEQVREAVAQAYHKYQKCGLSAARRLFVNQ